MNKPRILGLGQQLLSLGLAALVSAALLFSLGVQADVEHAQALAQPAQAQPLCALQPAAAQS